jgi:hypothetical protein
MIQRIQFLPGQTLRLFHRLVPNSAISIEYFWNMAIRLLVNSAMTLRISTGDLIVTSLWAIQKPIACWLVPFPAALLDKPARLPWVKKKQTLSLNRYPSSSVCSHLVRLSPVSQQGEPLVLGRYDAQGAIQSSLPQPNAGG